MASPGAYSVPLESERLLHHGIIQHDYHKTRLPREAAEYAKLVRFEGTDNPSIAINWRYAESVASLKGLEAVMINVLLKRKYGVKPVEVVINTSVPSIISIPLLIFTYDRDHAQLFFMSALFVQVNVKPEDPIDPTPVRGLTEKYAWAFPTQDLHSMASSLYRRAATNIYKTRDGQYLHLHGRLRRPDRQAYRIAR